MRHSVSVELGGRTLTLETGHLARQAGGSVMVSYGDTRVLVTACAASEPRVGIDFMPLTVEFQERFYAAGKIPGSFMKREGRPTNDAILSGRLIDRPIRPLFPEGFHCDTQVVATILSLDAEADADVAASIGASAALHLSDVPFNGPTAACRVGRIGGKFVINPTWAQIEAGETDMEIMIAGTADAIMMVEGGAREAGETDVLEAILLGHREIQRVVKVVEELRKKAGTPKRAFTAPAAEATLVQKVESSAKKALQEALKTKDKGERYAKVKVAKNATLTALVTEELKNNDPAAAKTQTETVAKHFETLQYNLMRSMILDEGVRIDGRDTKTVRPIAVEVGLLPRPHGSALFTRGETQVLSAVTLGTSDDEQIVDSLYQNTMRKFMLHYNFPPFSVGETGRFTGQSRREIGHGMLAERSIKAMMPTFEEFPYTVRIVCETLESNGSSSMGSVCSASMALMHAGVPYLKPVAGIAMGLIKEGDRVAVLTDILGDEDHLGDMDFKVAGTADGVTGIQMDIKIAGVSEAVLRQALSQAKDGRLHILNQMAKAITAPREDLSAFAPRITTFQIPIEKIREVIGTGGKVIRDIIAKTGCKIDIEDSGTVRVASSDGAAARKAIEIIQGIVAEAEIGKTYNGVVKRIVDFGAFVAIMPGQEGLLHVSEIAHERVRHASDFFKEGDEIEVKVLEVDPNSGKVRLSRKALLPVPEGMHGAGHQSGGSAATAQQAPPKQRPVPSGAKAPITPKAPNVN